VEAARAAIRRHRMLAGGDTILVAVSGGPDSTCLLDVLWRLSGELDLHLAIAHVDHGLSDGSAEIASRVAARAARDGFDIHVVKAPDLAGPNLHSRARAFRYAFFETIADGVGARKIATGHTLDDRVETTLARLVHGAGTAGVAGLPPFDGVRIRPLVGLRRAETRAYCVELGLEFFDDPANEDPRFERSAVRGGPLAAIEARWGDGGIRAVARSAERLREDADALEDIAERAYPELARVVDGRVELHLGAVLQLPRGLRRRMLETAVGQLRDRAGAIEAVLDALEEDPRPGARFALPGGEEIIIEAAHLSVPAASPGSIAED
jgi:tRNA(Ile)-lysidine synthetase-like protein